MKNYLQIALSLICCIVMIVCIFSLKDMYEDLKLSNIEISGRIDGLKSDILDLDDELTEYFEQHNNLLSDHGSEVITIDSQNLTAKVQYTVVAEDYSPNTTTASLYCNGTEYPMEYSEGRFTAIMELPIGKSSVVEKVVFNTNGNLKTQTIEDTIAAESLLPQIYLDTADSEMSYHNEGDSIIYRYSCTLQLTINHYGNGVEKDNFEIIGNTQKNTGWAYDGELKNISDDGKTMTAEIDIFEEFRAYPGKTTEVYLEYTDKNDWRYVMPVIKVKAIPSGGLSEEGFSGRPADIYNSDNKLIYSVDKQ